MTSLGIPIDARVLFAYFSRESLNAPKRQLACDSGSIHQAVACLEQPKRQLVEFLRNEKHLAVPIIDLNFFGYNYPIEVQ